MAEFFKALLDPRVIDAVKNIGIPTVILGMLMLGIYRASTWSGENVLKPLVAQQIEFMKDVSLASKKKQRDARTDGCRDRQVAGSR